MSEIILEGIFYTLNNNKEAYVGNNSDINSNAVLGDFNKELILPETFSVNSTNYIVTRISKNAFRRCLKIKSIFIPASVTHILYRGFDQCVNLKKNNIWEEFQIKDY